MRASRSLPAALALLWLGGCATPAPKLPELRLDGWHEIRAGEVALLAPVEPAELQSYAEAVATLLAVARRITNAPQQESRIPTRVVLVPKAVYEQLGAPEHTAGVASTRLSGHFLAVQLGRPVYVRHTLLHEVAHFLAAKTSAFPYPFWYQEGFAELLSSVKRREEVVLVGAPPLGSLDRLRQTKQVDVAPVLGLKRGDVVEDAQLAYALSWSIAHFLSADSARREPLVRLLRLQGEGVPVEDAVSRALAIDLGELSRRVDVHVRALGGGAPGEIAAFQVDTLDLPQVGAIRPVPPVEVAWWLGEHASSLEQDEPTRSPACGFYARALSVQPAHARARAAVALCAARAGDVAAADAQIARAAAEAPEDARVQTLAGRIALTRANASNPPDPANLRSARSAFERARALEPEDAAAWAGLGMSYAAESEDPAQGIAALERARELGVFDASQNLLLGKLRLRAGDRDGARVTLGEVARLDPGGDAGAAAERLLGELGAAQ